MQNFIIFTFINTPNLHLKGILDLKCYNALIVLFIYRTKQLFFKHNFMCKKKLENLY